MQDKRFDIFSERLLGSVRTMYDPKTKEIWFHAVDVSHCLGHKSAAVTVSTQTAPGDRLQINRRDVDDEVKKLLWTSTKGRGTATFITEVAVYKLIMAARTEEADRFKEWISEVLKSIRQDGGYILGQEDLSGDDLMSLKIEIKNLYSQVCKKTSALEKAESDVRRLQLRRHELIAEKSELKSQNKKLKKETKYLTEDANYWYQMYEKLRLEYEEFAASSSGSNEPNNSTPVFPETEYAMTPDGMVIKKSDWADYQDN